MVVVVLLLKGLPGAAGGGEGGRPGSRSRRSPRGTRRGGSCGPSQPPAAPPGLGRPLGRNQHVAFAPPLRANTWLLRSSVRRPSRPPPRAPPSPALGLPGPSARTCEHRIRKARSDILEGAGGLLSGREAGEAGEAPSQQQQQHQEGSPVRASLESGRDRSPSVFRVGPGFARPRSEMASLAKKDSYLQRLAQKICTQEVEEPRKGKRGTGSGEDDAQPKKKKRKKPKKCAQGVGGAPPGKPAVTDACKAGAKPTAAKAKNLAPGVQAPSGVSGSVAAGEKDDRGQNGVTGGKSGPNSFSTMTLLRQMLHEKIQEVSGQGRSKELSPAALKKQQRRKYEKERKKRRRKELRIKEKTEKKEAGEVSTGAILELPAPKIDGKSEIVFNKVEVNEEQLNKAEKRKEKRQALKGNLTPLTGKNYKQLLSRLVMRKSKLEDLKDRDEKKAQDLETKMRWTNILYKAEGVKIRDDEDRLKMALKRKEQRKAQRQKQWEKRTEQVVEKMQERQDKRRKNLQKKKLVKMERKKSKARKKGRVLPEDLK